jgi:hypothetical protein
MLLALTLLSASAVFAQSSSSIDISRQSITKVPSPLSLEVFSAFDIPLGDGSSWFATPGQLTRGERYRIPLSTFSLFGGIEYSFVSIQAATSLSLTLAKGRWGHTDPPDKWNSSTCVRPRGLLLRQCRRKNHVRVI